MAKDLVLPSEIPWGSLHGKDLEECLYWLIDSMGGKDLEWRLGGKGKGAPDQGRDLEAHFYVPGPDGELIRQKWWFEAKGCVRAKTVRKPKVQEAVLNAAGNPNLDVLVVVTNTVFSNPTIDWVKEWQKSNPRPKVLRWDRNKLEKLLSNHPEVAIRLFSGALSLQGRLGVVRSRFWNYAYYTDKPTLKLLWKERRNLKWDPRSLLAVVISEVANGRIEYRPWVAFMKPDDLANVFIHGLLNTFYFVNRAESVGTNQKPFLKGMSYLLLAALNSLPLKTIKLLLKKGWEYTEGTPIPEEHREYIIRPIFEQLAKELNDVCHNDCERELSRDPFELTENEVELYWDRLRLHSEDQDEDEEVKTTIFRIERSMPCKLGIELEKDRRCPLSTITDEKRDIEEMLDIIQRVIQTRKNEES